MTLPPIHSGAKLMRVTVWAFAAVIIALGPASAFAQKPADKNCPRPAAGSAIVEPENLRSHDGVLEVELSYTNYLDPNGHMRYCYVSKDGAEAPTLRLKPGDLL